MQKLVSSTPLAKSIVNIFLPERTLVGTDRGWQFIHKVNYDTVLMCYDSVEHKIIYKPCKGIDKTKFDGTLYGNRKQLYHHKDLYTIEDSLLFDKPEDYKSKHSYILSKTYNRICISECAPYKYSGMLYVFNENPIVCYNHKFEREDLLYLNTVNYVINDFKF